MVKIIQYRYYGDEDPKTYLPHGMKGADLSTHNLFQDLGGEVIKLGIQAVPGTQFYLNSDSASGHVLTVGHTGIYELDVEGLTTLTHLLFKTDTLNVAGNGLIVDIVYQTLEV